MAAGRLEEECELDVSASASSAALEQLLLGASVVLARRADCVLAMTALKALQRDGAPVAHPPALFVNEKEKSVRKAGKTAERMAACVRAGKPGLMFWFLFFFWLVFANEMRKVLCELLREQQVCECKCWLDGALHPTDGSLLEDALLTVGKEAKTETCFFVLSSALFKLQSWLLRSAMTFRFCATPPPT